ncbi:MAG: hypothetical protein KF799_05530 [Bdellovibrionales bacterium]|nr:hypothetical protein [Bdellovibrionales bacterium]
MSCQENLAADFPAVLNEWIRHSTTPGYYHQSGQEMNSELKQALTEIAELPAEQRNFVNTVRAADQALDRYAARGLTLKTVASLQALPPELTAETETFEASYQEGLARFASDSTLFRALENVATAPGEETELKLALLRRLKNGGASLPESVRIRINELTGKGAALTAQFRSALQNDTSAVDLGAGDVEGIPAELLAPYTTKNGSIRLPVADPSIVRDVLTHARSEATRRKIYLAYRGRNDDNARRLLEITRINAEIARLNGKSDWLHKVITDRSLAGGPEQVEALLNDLKKGFQPAIARHLQKLSERKGADGLNTPLRPWDWFYYDTLLNDTQGAESSRALNVENEAADYFPATHFLSSYFNYLKTTFLITFEEIKDVDVWHESVQLFRVRDLRDGRALGFIYFDLYSRPGKNASTAFVEELISRRKVDGDVRLPVAILMTNWGPYDQRATLNVSLGDVQTTLHEMGHALHALFQQGSYFQLSGWTHPTDHMEVPSTSLDRTVKIPEVLVALSSHRLDAGKKLPLTLAEKLAAGERGFQLLNGDFFSSSHMMNTVFLSLLDIELQKKIAELESPTDLHALYRRMFIDFFGVDPTDEDHFVQTFHHISGEYAGYYSSYINAGVAAANVVARQQELGGVMNPEALLKWRREVLEVPQNEKRISEVMESFLGRPLSADPVFKEQGLQP